MLYNIFLARDINAVKFFVRNAINYFIRSRPFEVTVFLTSLCNFRCSHCFYWKKLNNKDQLTLEEFQTLAKSMPAVERLLFTGGEPFLREDIDMIVAEFYKYSRPLYITIPTNGYFTDKIIRKTEKILLCTPGSYVNISVSLDELGEKRDEIAKVKGSFERLTQTVKELKELQSRFPNLGVTAICTQTSENENRLNEIYDYATNKLCVDNFGFAVVRGDPKSPEVKNIDPQKYRAMCNKMIDSYNRNTCASKIPFYHVYFAIRKLVYKYTYKTLVDNSPQIRCLAGIMRIVILENGDIYPCEVLMDLGKEFLVGNLKDFNMDFMKLWKSEKKKEITRKIRQKQCFCTHGCDMTVNILFDRKLPLQFLKLVS